MLDVCGKYTIVFNLLNVIPKCIGNVLYVPKLAKTLLSITELIEQGFKVEFETTKCWLKSYDLNLKWFLKLFKKEGYKMVKVVQSLVVECSTKIRKNNLWH